MEGNTIQTHDVPRLSEPAVKLAQRAESLAARGNGRYTLELTIVEGLWVLVVDGGKVEVLGRIHDD